MPKLVFLQEIWVSSSDENAINEKLNQYSIQVATPDQFVNPEDKLGNPDHTWHGAAIMWHETLNSDILAIPNSHDRFTGVKINVCGHSVLAISAYLPTSGRDDEMLECLAELSNYIVVNNKNVDTIIIGMDSNCSVKSTPRRQISFKLFCEENNLSKFSHPDPTFHHHNGSSSCIDYFLITTKSACMIDSISLQCNQEYPQNLSSHDPVIAALLVPSTAQTCKQGLYEHTYSDFEQRKIVWDIDRVPEYQALANKALSEYDALFAPLDCIPLKCKLYSELLVKAAEICFDTLPNKPARKDKHSPHLHQAWQHLQRCYKIWKNNGNPRQSDNNLFVLYAAARSKFQQARRYDNNLKSIRFNNKLMHTHRADRNKHFKLLKNLRRCPPKQCISTLYTPAGEYHGGDILEGFARDAERLGEFVGESSEYDNDFYKLCVKDNSYIFEIKSENCLKIPLMKYADLEKIIGKDMKKGKACDIYRLTAEHLKHAGTEAKITILKLINDIIENMHYLACTEIKAGLGTAVWKGKRKPLSNSSSYRRITVTPQLGSLLDHYVDPIAEKLFLTTQSEDQYGFTKNISHLMAAVLRGECQRWALDTKQTCFGISFDGQAAFPSVDRDIQVRELYSCGETGNLLEYSSNTYKNTVCRMKQGGKLSREIREYKGNRQGHKRAAGNFKSYINPCLTAVNSSGLGFHIGPICVSVICVADDTYVLSGNPRDLQGLVNIIGHYGKRYRLIFGADKTKVTVTGSRQDIQYYSSIPIWSLYGEKLNVSEDNDHLGMVVSGIDEEIKNIDKNIRSARNTLYSFLGNIFSYRCKLSQVVQYHTWSVYVKPVLRSGLAALPIRPSVMKPLTTFQNKILRAILKLSPYSPIAPLYFMLGELPLEASLHTDIFSLFWNIWTNPQTKVFSVLKYLLMMASSSSVTWSAHVRILFQQYSLPDPLELLSGQPWPKERWKCRTQTAVRAYHEAVWRDKAASNYKLQYLNVQCTGLSSRPHPVLSWVQTTQDVEIVRPHIKLLCGDYLCYDYLSHDRGTDPQCRLCSSMSNQVTAPVEDIEHILTQCLATSDAREERLVILLNTIAYPCSENNLLLNPSSKTLTQFILDCSSLNLPNDTRISPDHPAFIDITRQCSYYVHAVHKHRTRQLKSLGLLGKRK